MSSRFFRRPASWWQRLAAAGAVLTAVAWPAAAGASQFTPRPLPSRPGDTYVNIAVSQTRVWVFANARTKAPGSIVELNKATGRQIGTLRERQPGQATWVVAAYRNHPWTTMVPADGIPALAEVSASGAFTHRVNLAYELIPVIPPRPITGAATLAGSHLWAVTGSPRGNPTGLVQVSAGSGAQTGSLPWPQALRGFFPAGLAVSGGQIWMTDGGCKVARVTISSSQGRIFRLPSRDCRLRSLPAQISASGGRVWVEAHATVVANAGSVAELNARNGHLVRLITGRKYGWDLPSFVVSGPYLWVTSQTGGFNGNGSVTELSASTGRLVHLFSARRYHFGHPFAIAAFGSHVWVLNVHSVTKL
jgi:hypothetical protein